MSDRPAQSQEVQNWLENLPKKKPENLTSEKQTEHIEAITYARTRSLYTDSGKLHGWFAMNRDSACVVSSYGNPIDSWKVIRTRSLGPCAANGDDLTEITF